jgi:hypothetical protein
MTNEATNHEVGRIYQPHSNRKSSAYAGLIVAGVLALATSPTVAATNDLNSLVPPVTTTCNVQDIKTRLIEWDFDPHGDIVPGSVVVDDRSNSRHSKVWFATRNGETRVYRFTPGRGIKKDRAEATSWALGAGATGGVRLRHSGDGKVVFVNTLRDPFVPPDAGTGALVAVDTGSNKRITWTDRPGHPQMSDVAVDTRGGANSVYTAAPTYTYRDANGVTQTDGIDGVVQRLKPLHPQLKGTTWIVPADVTRWPIGGGAGTCVDEGGAGTPCIPGVTVDRRNGSVIFASQPQFANADGSVGAIAEIDTKPVSCPNEPYSTCAKVRHWPMPAFTAAPRQILLDDNGRLWGITTTGHIFSLDVERHYNKGTVTRHDPLGAVEDLFAVAPDGGTIGFTDSNNDKVGVLFPKRVPKTVTPRVTYVKPVMRKLDGVRQDVTPEPHMVDPREVTTAGLKYTNQGDGTYVETNVSTGLDDTAPSIAPTGVAPDGARKTGSFFYGVSLNNNGTNRIGHVDLRVDPNEETDHRKDDDDFDDDGDDDDHDADDDDDGHHDDNDDDDDNDCIPDHMDKDWDNDGVENEHDSKSNRENKRTDRGTMAPGGAKEYEMASDANSLLMVAIVEAADATTPLSIELVDPNGIVVLAVPTVLGKAVATATPALPGLYTVRVRNTGLRSTTYKTTLVGKSIWF